jgi:hypothetical protein
MDRCSNPICVLGASEHRTHACACFQLGDIILLRALISRWRYSIRPSERVASDVSEVGCL